MENPKEQLPVSESIERICDKTLGGNDRSNELTHVVGSVAGAACMLYSKIAYRFKVVNGEALAQFKGKKNGVVVMSPHTSYYDVVAMYIAARPTGQFIRIFGRNTLFTVAGGVLGRFLALVGATPIKRDTSDRTALKRATRMLKNGEILGIFPEGTRRGKGSVEPALHGGAALFARMGKASLLPLGLKGCDKIQPKGQRPHFPRVTAEFGKPYSISSFDFLPKDQRLEGCTWYVLREAFALSHDIEPEQVDMAGLFPDCQDYSEIFAQHPIEPVDVSTLPDYEG